MDIDLLVIDESYTANMKLSSAILDKLAEVGYKVALMVILINYKPSVVKTLIRRRLKTFLIDCLMWM